jgi:LemA protein
MALAHSLLVLLALTGLLLAVYAVLLYNNLVAVRNNVARAWANIDVLLKQRHDELPKLMDVCRGYKQFEQETLVRVAEARARVAQAREAQNVAALGPAEASLRAGVARVFSLAEGYPELKANQNFLLLQARISALEDSIADRREFYNECVNVNNVRIEQFPDLFVARLFGFREARMLELGA